jgi:hypothetical protein
VAVIYQPPTTNASASFGLRQTSGAGTIGFVGLADIPQATPHVKDITTAVDTLHGIASAAQLLPYGAIIGKILDGAAFIVGLFKSEAGLQEQVSITVNTETDVTFVYSQEFIGSSDPIAGSPEGDAIMFIRDVAFAYVVMDRQLMIIPLGTGSIDVAEVASLRPGAPNPPDLPGDARALLLAADPVASGTAYRFGSPDPARFTYIRTYDHYDHSGITFVQSHTETTDEKTTTTSVTSDLSGQLLHIAQTGGTSASTSFTTTAALAINGPVHLPIYFDKLYGTYAFLDPIPDIGVLRPPPTTIFQGQLTSASKVPLPRQIVSLQHGPELLTTVTDSQGRYKFMSTITGGGTGALFVPSHEVNAPPTPVSVQEPQSSSIAIAVTPALRRTSGPVVAATENGALSAFLIGQDTALYRYDQDGPNGGWGEAHSMAGTWPLQLPVVAATENGALSAFLIGQDTALYRYDQDGPNGGWGEAHSMAGTWPLQLPVVAATENGALSAFLIGRDTALYRYDQDGPYDEWNAPPPQSMGGTW